MIRLCLLLICLFSPYALAEEKVLYCVEEEANGHAIDDGELVSAKFNVGRFAVKVLETQTFADQQYLLDIIIDDRNYSCRRPWRDSVVCIDNSFGHADAFIYNRRSKRFTGVRASVFGFTYGDDGDDEKVSAGKCEDF